MERERSIRTRSGLLPLLLLFLLSPLAWSGRPLVTEVSSIGLTVTDIDRSAAFYEDVLGFVRDGEVSEVAGDRWEHLYGVFGLRLRVARLRLGGESIELLQFLAPAGRPVPADSRSNDRWFQHVAIIVRDMDVAYARLRRAGITHASPGPQRLPDWNPNAGGIRAFYFRDPDGNHLEILEFPEGKGAARWHAPGDDLFLGIDHTAIVVADTDLSLRYYRDLLGMRVAGESDNSGPEQERLNNVFGARLRITALRAAAGPGIELLEYVTPRDGRPMPADSRAGDRWYWQVNLATEAAAGAWQALRGARQALVSPTAVALPDREQGFRAAALVRDPDGHALLLRER
jgi:catechol 2,3-dioxygenase-like lactoylglutathione lyase family enzyme